jgi:hypothetical protein
LAQTAETAELAESVAKPPELAE